MSDNNENKPVNCWQYSRDVYLVGRSLKFRSFTEKERAAVIEFISAMASTRPAYVPYINQKSGNPPAAEFVESNGEKELVWSGLEKQNDYNLGKMVQKIGRSLKIQFCTAEEKELCDALFEATDFRRAMTINDYATDKEEESSDSEAQEESSSAPVQSSSAAPESSSEQLIP